MPFRSRGASVVATIGATPWGPGATPRMVDTAGSTVVTLNAALRMASTIFVAPKDGTINKVGVEITNVTGVPPTFRFGIMTVDAATGRPTAAAAGGSAEELFAPVATGWLWVTLATPAVVAAGDVLAAQIREGPVAPSGANRITVVGTRGLRQVARYPHTVTNPAGFIVSDGIGVAALYNDGSPAIPSLLTVNEIIATDLTHDEVGALLTLPFDAVCTGAMMAYTIGAGTASNHSINLYNASTGLLLKTVPVTALQLTLGIAVAASLFWWAPISLAAQQNYRLSIKCLTAAPLSITVPIAETFEASSHRWWPEGQVWSYTARLGAGVWGAADPLKLPMFALLLSSMSVPS